MSNVNMIDIERCLHAPFFLSNLLTINGELVNVEYEFKPTKWYKLNLSRGVTLFTPKCKVLNRDLEYVSISSINKGDIICRKRESLKSPHNRQKSIQFSVGKQRDDCEVLMGKQFFYLLGWLIGDGNVTSNDRITFYFNTKDGVESEMIRKLVISKFPSSKEYKCTPDRITVLSTSLREKLATLGLEYRSSIYKTIPSLVFLTNLQNQRSFLRGLFDSDGSVQEDCGRNSDGVYASFSSSSYSLVMQVNTMLYHLGIMSTIVKQSNKKHKKHDGSTIKESVVYSLVVTGKNSMREFARQIGFSIPIKREKCNLALKNDKYSDSRYFKVARYVSQLLSLNEYKKLRYKLTKHGDKQSIDTDRSISSEILTNILDLYGDHSEDCNYKFLSDVLNYDFYEVLSVETINSNSSFFLQDNVILNSFPIMLE